VICTKPQAGRRDLVDRVTALEGSERLSKANRESLDPHAAKTRDREMTRLVQHDEQGEP